MICYGDDLLSSEWGEPTTHKDATPEAIWLHEQMERTRHERERSEKIVNLTRSQVCQPGKIHQCSLALDLIFWEPSYIYVYVDRYPGLMLSPRITFACQ